MADSGEQAADSVPHGLADGSARRVVVARKSSSGRTAASVSAGDNPSKKGTAKKTPAKKTSDKKTSAKKAAAEKAPAKKSPAKKSPAKKTAGKKTAGKKTAGKKDAPSRLAVRADERPWTEEELAEVRDLLREESTRLRTEISEAEDGIAEMLRDSADTGGEDQADTGSKTFEREHEMALAASHREILGQTERALSRIEDGTYGICENCGNPIGKARLLAFPRATLCMTCKEREERR
jgi:RNA polymerase-binding protein DksA